MTNNDLRNITQKTKDREILIPLKTKLNKLYTNGGGVNEQHLTATGKVQRVWTETTNVVFVAATMCLLGFVVYKLKRSLMCWEPGTLQTHCRI